MITNQAYIFLIFIVKGITIGLLFDIFRILRLSFKTKDIITYIEDILFWLLTAFIILYSIFKFNNGEIRFFIFLALALGVLLYITAFSSSIVKLGVYVIKYIKKISKKFFNMLKMPFIFIYKLVKILIKKISFKSVNIRNKKRQKII